MLKKSQVIPFTLLQKAGKIDLCGSLWFYCITLPFPVCNGKSPCPNFNRHIVIVLTNKIVRNEEPPIMSRVQKTSMRTQCYEIIKEKILRQEYNFGAELNIATLSAELSVSNTPIREALSQLESEGLIITAMNAKAHVVSFTSESFGHLADTIYILIKGAYELCVREERIPALLSAMEHSLHTQEKLLAIGDDFDFTKELVHFDQSIFEVLANPQLLFLFQKISQLLFLMYYTNNQNRSDWEHARSIAEHRKIIAAIASGDHAEVDKLAREHCYQIYFE